MEDKNMTAQQKIWINTGIVWYAVRPMLLYLLLPPAISTIAMFFYGLKEQPEYFILKSGQFYRTLGLAVTFYILHRRCKKRGGSVWEETNMCWRQTDPRKVLLLAGAGVGFSLFMSALLTVVPFPRFLIGPYHSMSSQIYGSVDMLLAALSVIVLAPVLEEMIFRGYVLGRLMNGFESDKTAVLLTTALFAVCHGTPLWIAYALFMGLLLAHVSIAEDNTVYAAALHMGYNLLTVPLSIANNRPEISGVLFASPVLIAAYGAIGLSAALLCLRSYPLHLGVLKQYLPLGGRRKCGHENG